MNRLLAVVTTLLICALLAPAAALAANPAGFDAVFPRAGALCTKADNGKLGKKLKPSKTKVLAACAKLRKAYTDAQSAYESAAAPLTAQARQVVLDQRAACRAAKLAHNPRGCREAQVQARAKLQALRQQIAPLAAARAAKFKSARKAFWSAIKKLKGAESLKTDSDDATPAPSNDVPSDNELDSA